MFFRNKKIKEKKDLDKFVNYIKKNYNFDKVDIIDLNSKLDMNNLVVQAAIDDICSLSEDNNRTFDLERIQRAYYNLVSQYKKPSIMVLTKQHNHFDHISYIFYYKTNNSFIIPVKYLSDYTIFGKHTLIDKDRGYGFLQVDYYQFLIDNYIESIDQGIYFQIKYNPEFPILSISENLRLVKNSDTSNFHVDILIRRGHGKKSDGTLFDGLHIELWLKDILLKSGTATLPDGNKYLVSLLDDFLFPLNFSSDEYSTLNITPSLTVEFIENVPDELLTIKKMLDI